jgi:hypothetical protein
MDAFLERLDAAWTRFEVALCVAVAAALTALLVLWVVLKGLSSRTTGTYVAGLALRSLAGALILGVLFRFITRRWPGSARWRDALTAAAVVSGIATAWLWRDQGAAYFGNLLGWLQDGSTLTLVGGLRGLGTRLTLWLALLGASLATASGRHASIDALPRALGETARGVLNRAGALVAAFVCIIACWGFFDFIAIDAFGAPAQGGDGEKVAAVARGVSRHLFIARRQLALDAHTLGPVLTGKPWDRSLSAGQWNEWLRSADWASHFGDAAASALRESDAATVRAPLVSVPGEPSRGLLVKSLNLIVPFGLFMIALRFALWALRGAPSAEAYPVDTRATARMREGAP